MIELWDLNLIRDYYILIHVTYWMIWPVIAHNNDAFLSFLCLGDCCNNTYAVMVVKYPPWNTSEQTNIGIIDTYFSFI